jgi:hypothetical protein
MARLISQIRRATIKVANSQLAEDLRDQISNALTKCIPSSLEEQLNLIKKAVSANTLALKQLQMRDQIDITLQLKDNKFMGRAPTLSQFTLQQNVEKASHTISDMQWLIQNSSQMKNSTDAFVVLKVENPWSEVKICLHRW